MSVRGKVFVRKSRRGNVQVIAREHYLRDDLSCGVLRCPSCPVSLDTSLHFSSSYLTISILTIAIVFLFYVSAEEELRKSYRES